MCGIAVVVGPRASAEVVNAMSARMRHRGPDGDGTWTAPGIALAHRRLSILDLSEAGRQPMTSHDGRYVISFNGEIYNYLELAQTMPDVAWRSRSDTEVLLELFARKGAACVRELVGMFAFAIWDRETRRLFVARDPVGIKPAYVARLGDSWCIASEIGALLAAGVPAQADDAVIYDFLARDFYEHGDDTFFRGITKVPPGHTQWIDDRGPQPPERYWDLGAEVARTTVSADAIERGEELVARMEAAVRLALRSDVPVGVTLSGGLDSATLLALVDRVQPDASKIGVFSFDFPGEAYSERPWVLQMAAHTGHPASFRQVVPDDFVANLDAELQHQQEPHAGLPIVAYSLCFEAVRKAGSIVVMDGSGIDEALAGYDRFRPAHWADLAAANDLAELEAELASPDSGVGADNDSRALARMQMTSAASVTGDVGIGQDLTTSVAPAAIAHRLLAQARPMPRFERPFSDALRNLMYRELRYTKLPRALRFRDRFSMARGTELRPPFLDHRLLAYMFALPARDRIERGVTKSLLRKSAERLLPSAVRLAAKRSVQTPQREWFRGPLASWVRAQIDRPALWDRGWVDRTAALAALDRFQAGQGTNSFFLWQWIALARWAELFLP